MQPCLINYFDPLLLNFEFQQVTSLINRFFL
jgi:hypothetical protein